ncbi:hypothetical protein DVK02_04635 [Halobellus sp. Atlit-31R]|nr:hypothetical protein DVK02_04635 [Halobellus sp. Atlit-31R]
MSEPTYRPPTADEHDQIEAAFNDYYAYGGHTALDDYPVVVVDEYETGDGTYSGRLAVVIDGGANSTTYGFDDDGAFLVSDALNEKAGEDVF